MIRRATLFLLASALAISCVIAPRAHAQGGIDPPGVNPTHYWSYKLLQPVLHPNSVLASDQFFPALIPVDLDSLDRLVNWVQKNGSHVPDTLIHYTWWNIRNKLPLANTSVILTNQFGQYPANVLNLDFMLVPAWKNQPQPVPPNANHYLCYRAVGPPPQPFSYDLVDEWRQDVQVPGPLQFLCVPCMKIHGGQVFPVLDSLTHLAVYPIVPFSDVFYPFIKDQFFQGPVPVQQKPTEYLFVPTIKQLIVTPTKKSTWGEIKTRYR
jgi:hypothetical protein